VAIVEEPKWSVGIFTEKKLFYVGSKHEQLRCGQKKNLAAMFSGRISHRQTSYVPEVLDRLVASFSARLGYLDEAFQLLKRATKKPQNGRAAI